MLMTDPDNGKDVPIGLTLLVTPYPHLPDHSRDATFLWFLSEFPADLAAQPDAVPKMIGSALLDYSLAVSFSQEFHGRVGLHAAPEGGAGLANWYGTRKKYRPSFRRKTPRRPGRCCVAFRTTISSTSQKHRSMPTNSCRTGGDLWPAEWTLSTWFSVASLRSPRRTMRRWSACSTSSSGMGFTGPPQSGPQGLSPLGGPFFGTLEMPFFTEQELNPAEFLDVIQAMQLRGVNSGMDALSTSFKSLAGTVPSV
jgi:hypothetical protein